MKTKEMTLQLQPNRWSCLATAFAMALDINVEDLIKDLGHDGSQILFPELDENGRAGHHIQEIMDYCLANSVRVVTIDAMPLSKYPGFEGRQYCSDEHLQGRMAHYLENYYGVLAGSTKEGYNHAVAWNGEKIYNPAGIIEADFEHLDIMHFFIVGKL